MYDSSPMSGQPVPYMARTRRYYEAQGFERAYVWAHFEEVPFTPLAKPLAESTFGGGQHVGALRPGSD